MEYNIIEEEFLSIESLSTKRYYFIGGIVLTVGFAILLYIFLLGYRTHPTYGILLNTLIFYLFILALLILGIAATLSFVCMFSKSNSEKIKSELVKSVAFSTQGIRYKYFNNTIQFIPYSEFTDNTIFRIGFTNALGLKIFKSVDDFFSGAYTFIREVIDRHPNKRVYVVISALKRGKDTPFFQIIISPEVVDINSFLVDWFENYRKYFKEVKGKERKP